MAIQLWGNPFITALNKAAGNAVDKVGTKLRLPELGISEAIAGGRTANTGTKSVLGLASFTNRVSSPTPTTGGQNYSTTQNYSTNTSGQQGADYSGGTRVSGGSATLTQPTGGAPIDEGSYLQNLRDAYAQSRSGIEAQSPLLDQTYNQGKSDIEGAIADAQKTADTQKSTNEQTYGDILKNQLRTYQDLNRQRQGTFSALGTLDSSAFAEDQFRGDQQLGEQRARTELEKAKSNQAIDQQFATYQRQAQSELAKYGMQYQQGKIALQQALADNNIQEASALQQALDNIRQRAASIQDTVTNFNNQVALLKAQGVNVNTAIGGLNGNEYATSTNNQLASALQQGSAKYTIPTNNLNTKSQGYIIDGRGRKIDPKTGMVIG